MNIFKKMQFNSLIKKVRKYHQIREQGTQTNIQDEIQALCKLAALYDANRYDKKLPKAEYLAMEYYRVAAALGDPESQYRCGQYFLEQGKFWDAWSRDIYGDDIHKKYAADAYQEAFQYLNTAAKNGYALAKRLHGLAYIYGWGVDRNTETGFQYVLDSIEMEGAWDRATKILDELKLNSPEFFAALMSYQAGKK